MAKGEISHIEFPADDPARATRFYGAVAGWEFERDGGLRRLLPVPQRPRAGGADRQARRVDRAALRIYITVDCWRTRAPRPSRTAARSSRRQSDIGGDMGRFAACRTPRANEIGLSVAPARAATAPPARGARPSIWACASSTPTATSTRTASPTTSTPCWRPRATRASSGSSSRAGTCARGARPGARRAPAVARRRGRRPSARRGRGRYRPAGPHLETWARDERVVAIGETGLDSDRMFSPWDAQLENLRRNLALALETGKPAILHCRSRAGERDAQDTLVRELRAAGFGGEARGRRSATGRRR